MLTHELQALPLPWQPVASSASLHFRTSIKNCLCQVSLVKIFVLNQVLHLKKYKNFPHLQILNLLRNWGRKDKIKEQEVS